MSGPRSAYSHGAPTARRLEHGDFGNIEFGATFNRYTATIGRNFALGEPTPRMAELHDVVLRASDAMIAAIRDKFPRNVADRNIAAATEAHALLLQAGEGVHA